jgi:hypothetical protein
MLFNEITAFFRIYLDYVKMAVLFLVFTAESIAESIRYRLSPCGIIRFIFFLRNYSKTSSQRMGEMPVPFFICSVRQ